ncbi:SMC family ATPase, partial [Oryzihumus leptocrescens]|uniref:SMC family ATPase n=1 Tax=Oryzihumus leptocrescens TaxID=297536 RepID=UPI0031D73DBB
MRLHHLGITAFGPFAAECEVDLEELSSSGLFLIQGPTGAGKTSVLDAICFALYAALPGARSGARSNLRSDHAAEGAVPQVRLEFTAGGRRFLIVRSPEFQRPKKRGTGTTKVQASVVLEERVDGEWVNRGTRNDEVAQVVQDVVGMGLEQFVKVVLLPQGDFAAFLRASPEDRRTVLAKLFDTSRFTDIEAWLADRRRDLAAGLAESRAELGRHLAQVDTAVELLDLDDTGAESEAAAAELPLALPDWGSLPRPAVAAALTGLESAVTQHAGAALASRSLAEDRREAADVAWHAGRRTLELQEAAARAGAEL